MQSVKADCGGVTIVFAGLLGALLAVSSVARADDWPGFRGPRGDGVAPAEARVPVEWDGRTNIAWRRELPGPGASSPIVYNNRVYITCYSGYGLSRDEPGDIDNLKRHLVCLRLDNGAVEWTATLPKRGREHAYTSYLVGHGYASSTPAADETGVYVLFGTSGVVAYTHEGERRWIAPTGEGVMNFGSASSPILYKDMVIVNADVEAGAIIACRKRDGGEVWRHKPDHEPNTWNTPLIVSARGAGGVGGAGGKDELVTYGTRNEIIGVDPSDGERLWRCMIPMQSYQCPSPVAAGGVVFAIGNHPGDAVAVRLGGRGDVTATHRQWHLSKGSVVCSPVYHDGHLYWSKEDGVRFYCADAKTGELVYTQVAEPRVQRMYASPVLAGGRLYYVSQTMGTFVVEAKPRFKLLSRNVIEGDDSVFNGSPAVSGDRLLLRSDKAVYCVRQGD